MEVGNSLHRVTAYNLSHHLLQYRYSSDTEYTSSHCIHSLAQYIIMTNSVQLTISQN